MNTDSQLVRVFFAKMRPEYSQLSQTEQMEFMKKDRANLDMLGMKAISMIRGTAVDGEWDYIGVESWPSREAIIARERFEKEELFIDKYVAYKTFVGIEQSFDDYGK